MVEADFGLMGDVVVVGAAIVRGGRLLAAQRHEPPVLAGLWELPGGKVEAGEYDTAALVRECEEELGVKIALNDRVGGDWPVRDGYVLRVWTAEIVSGEARPLHDHSAIRWLSKDELYTVPWIPADRPIIAVLAERLG